MYESNDVVPSALTLKAIADALEVTTDYLLDSDGAAIKDTALFLQFKAIDNLPDSEKKPLSLSSPPSSCIIKQKELSPPEMTKTTPKRVALFFPFRKSFEEQLQAVLRQAKSTANSQG